MDALNQYLSAAQRRPRSPSGSANAGVDLDKVHSLVREALDEENARRRRILARQR